MHVRIKSALSETWDLSHGHSVISITCHSGTIQGLLTAIGHNHFKPKICGVVPLLIKGTPL